jgi:hypothetical protein
MPSIFSYRRVSLSKGRTQGRIEAVVEGMLRRRSSESQILIRARKSR